MDIKEMPKPGQFYIGPSTGQLVQLGRPMEPVFHGWPTFAVLRYLKYTLNYVTFPENHGWKLISPRKAYKMKHFLTLIGATLLLQGTVSEYSIQNGKIVLAEGSTLQTSQKGNVVTVKAL